MNEEVEEEDKEEAAAAATAAAVGHYDDTTVGCRYSRWMDRWHFFSRCKCRAPCWNGSRG